MDLRSILRSRPRNFSLPVAGAFGMALGFYPGVRFILPSLAMATFLAALGAVVLRVGNRSMRLRRMQLLAAAIGLAAGAAIAWSEAGGAEKIEDEAPGAVGGSAGIGTGLVALRPAWAEGRLAADSMPARNGFRSYPLRVERLGLAGRGASAEISYPGRGRGGDLRILARAGREIDAGSLIRASGSFSPGIGGSALFAQPRDLLLIDGGGRFDRARSAIRTVCRQALSRIGTRSAGLMQALILGVRDSLAPGEADAFKAAGCSHILALSGEHLSVFALLSIAALSPVLGPVRARLGGAILASAFMWIAGPGPSLLRAVLMAWIGAIAVALDRPQAWLGSLALAFLLMVPLDPSGARSLGFTLSYLAVWGLAVLGPRFSFLLGRMLPPFLREPASASLAAQAAVSPLLAFSFGYLQFAGIFASMAAGPVVMAIMWWGMGAGLVCSFLPFAAPFARPVSDLLYSALMGIMDAAAAVPTLPLPALGARVVASAAVVGLSALVYARPDAEYRAWLSRLRFAPGSAGPPRGRGSGHGQEIRPELPGE
jgi:competence protein ComEC